MTATTTKTVKVTKLYELIYRVESETTTGKFYIVVVRDGMPYSCDCPSYTHGKRLICKHMVRVRESIEYETFVDATERKEKLASVEKQEDDE